MLCSRDWPRTAISRPSAFTSTKKNMRNSFFAFLALALNAVNASACSFPLVPLDQQVEKAEQIFTVTLLEAKVMPKTDLHKWPWIEGRFQVSKILKGGPQTKELTLATGMGRGDCGVGMMVSAKYIIFKGRKDTGIGEDTGTRIIEDFQEDDVAAKIHSIIRRQEGQSRNK